MTLKLNDIVLDSADTTVLSYAVTTNPNPLQINSTGSITVVVYKSGPPAVLCNSLTFTLSKGSYDTDLTTDPTNIATSCPPGWSLSPPDGSGSFTFTPNPGNGTIGADGLSFEFNNIEVNDQVGGTPLKIEENVTLNNQSQTNRTSVTLSKFPQGFTLSDITINPPTNISPGSSATLSWYGTGSPCSYSLSYDTITIPVLNDQNYPTPPLLETTVFTLTVTAGGSTQFQKQAIVSVNQPVIGEFGVAGSQPEFLVGSTIQLYWTTQNAAYCNLNLNGINLAQNLPANVNAMQGYGVKVPLAPGAAQYVLSAYDSNGKESTASTLLVSVFQFKLLPNSIGNLANNATQMLMKTDGTIYVAGANGLDIVSTATNALIQHINWPGYGQVEGLGSQNPMVLSPDETQIYALLCNNSYPNPSSIVTVINTSNYQVQSIPVPWLLGGVAVGTKDGKACLVVTDLKQSDTAPWLSSYIYVLDPLNNYSLIQKLELPNSSNTIAAIIASPQGDRVFLCSYNITAQVDTQATEICIYNIASNTLSQVQLSEFSPSIGSGFSFSLDRSYWYVGGAQVDPVKKQESAAIAIVDSNTDQLIDTISFPPSGTPPLSLVSSLTLSPDGLHLYAQVTDLSSGTSVVRINLNTLQVVGTLSSPDALQFSALAVKPDGSCLYGMTPNVPSSTIRMIEISDGLNAFRLSET